MKEDVDRYTTWKSWSKEDLTNAGRVDAAYFDAEFKGMALQGRKVLEIGFSNG